MVAGVTGARQRLVVGLSRSVAALRKCTSLPIAVGFGVSNGRQAAEAAVAADAVVVGSALVKAARENRLKKLVCELRSALDRR
jgi:tryptophan synthase alpha chain